MVFINLELGIKHDGEMKLAKLQSVFEAIYMSTIKYEGELCTYELWVSILRKLLWTIKVFKHQLSEP